MTALHFATGQRGEADALVRRFHYSARPPSAVQLVATWHTDGGLFGDSGPAVAACYFSSPPTRWSEPVWELTRLVRAPEVDEPLTALIGLTVNFIKVRRPTVGLLVSFADPTVGHHGGIYQAASWHYDGQRATSMDGCVINGQFVPGRTLNGLYGTRSPSLLAERHGIEAEPHWDEGKHLYWRAITKAGKASASRLELRCLPYPKPNPELVRTAA